MFGYAYFVFPYQSWFADPKLYDLRFTPFYALENFALVSCWAVLAFVARGGWRRIYIHLLGASAFYAVSSTIANLMMDADRPYEGTLISLAQMAGVCWFCWIPLEARRTITAQSAVWPNETSGFTSISAKLAVTAIPLIGLWEVVRTDEGQDIRMYRLAAVLISMLLLSAAVFLKEDLAKREIVSDFRASRSRENLSKIALAESEDRYRDLVDHSQDLLCTHDLEGNLLTCNPAPARILGYEVAELLRVPMRNLIDPAHVDQFDAYMDRIRTIGHDSGILTVLTRSGEQRIWEYNNSLRTEGLSIPIVRGMAHDITERTRAERDLRATEKRFRQLAENIHEVFYLEDAETLQLLYVSPAYEQIWGRSCASAYSNVGSFLEGIHPEDQAAVRQCYMSRVPMMREYRVIRPDGTLRWIWDRGFPIRNSAGRIYRMAGIAEDITQRKLAEEALRKSEERYRTLFERSVTGVAIISMEGRVLDCNEAWVRIFGYSHVAEACNHPIIDHYIDPGNRSTYVAELQKEGSYYNREFQLRRRNGEKIWALVNSVMVQGETGSQIQTTVVDISKRKRAERALLESEGQQRSLANQSREAEDRLRLAMDAGGVGTWDWDLSTGVVDWPGETQSLVGLPSGSFGGTYEAFAALVHPEDLDRVNEGVRRTIDGRGEYHLEFRMIRPDGQVRWLETRGMVKRDETGKPTRFLGVAIDITERKSAEQAVQQSQADMARLARLATMGELTASIAHEINQPLTAVVASGGASLRWLAMQPPDVQEARQAMAATVREANRASDVIKRIRSLITNGSPQMHSLMSTK